MSRILLIDDDQDQLAVRRLILEQVGHEVVEADDTDAAREAFTRALPQIVLVDLRLQNHGEGLALIREFRTARPDIRIIVVSGWPADLAGREEAAMVDAVVPKPSRPARLLSTIAKLAMLALLILLPARAQKPAYPFQVDRPGEVIADIAMASPGANWSKAGAEAAMVDVRVDDRAPFNVMLYAGSQNQTYSVFLGALPPGPHRLSIERSEKFSAPSAGLAIAGVSFRTAQNAPAIVHAPILYARANTVGKFTDAPMLVYAEQRVENNEPVLQYTVIFTNEDGGTSTRALMARWGRTTDIEYVYRLNLKTNRAIIQGRDHKDIEFAGRMEDGHPLLMPITDNNMVGPAEGDTPIRYQIAPMMMDLRAYSRELVMDEQPVTYRVMAEELAREGKLRAFGQVDGEKISDPRNYLYVEALLRNTDSGLSVNVRVRGEDIWRAGDLGRVDYAISRSGWVRTTVELPPGTRLDQLAEIGFQCVVAPTSERKLPTAGLCRVDAVTRIFMLDRDYRPGPGIWVLPGPIDVATGEMQTFPVR